VNMNFVHRFIVVSNVVVFLTLLTLLNTRTLVSGNSNITNISSTSMPSPPDFLSIRVINGLIVGTIYPSSNYGGSIVTQYNGQVIGVLDNTSFVVFANQSTSIGKTFTINVLNATTSPYKVQVGACNSFGCGNTTTAETGLPSAPNSIQIQMLDNEQLQFTINDGHDGGQNITQYILEYSSQVLLSGIGLVNQNGFTNIGKETKLLVLPPSKVHVLNITYLEKLRKIIHSISSDLRFYPCNNMGCSKTGKKILLRPPLAPKQVSVRLFTDNKNKANVTIVPQIRDNEEPIQTYLIRSHYQSCFTSKNFSWILTKYSNGYNENACTDLPDLLFEVQSAGFPNTVKDDVQFWLNGVKLSLTISRGINYMSFNPQSGIVISQGCYDTFLSSSKADELAGVIEGLPDGSIVMLAVFDEGSRMRTTRLTTAVTTCGGTKFGSFGHRQSYAFVGTKGGSAELAVEKIAAGGANGLAKVGRTLQRACKSRGVLSVRNTPTCPVFWRKILQYGNQGYRLTPQKVGSLKLHASHGFAKLADRTINSFPSDAAGYHYYKLQHSYPSQCTFPFTFMGNVYEKCTNTGNNGKYWCSHEKIFVSNLLSSETEGVTWSACDDMVPLYVRTKSTFVDVERLFGWNAKSYDYSVGWNAQLPVTNSPGQVSPGQISSPGTGCDDLFINNGIKISGVYWIKPLKESPAVPVYCDMETDEGGWSLVYKIAGASNMKSTLSVNVAALRESNILDSASGKLDDESIRELCKDQYRVHQGAKAAFSATEKPTYLRFANILEYADDKLSDKYTSNVYSSDPSTYSNFRQDSYWSRGFSMWGQTNDAILQLNYQDWRLGSHIRLGHGSYSNCGSSGGCHAQVFCKRSNVVKKAWLTGGSNSPLNDCSQWWFENFTVTSRSFSSGTSLRCNRMKKNIVISKLVHGTVDDGASVNVKTNKNGILAEQSSLLKTFDDGETPTVFTVQSCNKFGCSDKTTFTTSVPQKPSQDTYLRITGPSQINFTGVSPKNDGGALVTSYVLFAINEKSDVISENIEHDGKIHTFDVASIRLKPTLFKVFAVNRLGISDDALEIRTTLPGKPSYVYTSNVAFETRKLKVAIRPPLDDGRAEITKYIFSPTCYEANSEKTAEITVNVNALTAQTDGAYFAEIDSPSDTSFTCRVDVQVCTFVGCSVERESSWNIGLKSSIHLKFQNVGLISKNMTYEMNMTAEANKAHPATTDIRWTHQLDEETKKTTLHSFGGGITKLSGVLTVPFAEKLLPLHLLDVEFAGQIIYEIEGRHCSASGLCSGWFHITNTPTFSIPAKPGALTLSKISSGGALRLSVAKPAYWGYKALQRGRKFRCSISFNGKQIGTYTIITLKASDTVGTTEFFDLSVDKEYKIVVFSMNGNQMSRGSSSVSGKPMANVPGRPQTPPQIISVSASSVIVNIQLPSFNGTPITKCKVSVGEIGNCGIINAVYKIDSTFRWDTNKFSIVSNNVDEDQAESVTSSSPPEPYSKYQLTLNNVDDGVRYVVRHQCANSIGYGPNSIPLNIFATPPNLKQRFVSISEGSDANCLQQFSANKCQSLTQAIVGTPFDYVKFWLEDGVYFQRSWIVKSIDVLMPANISNSTNITNNTSSSVNISVVGPGEEYPIHFSNDYSEVLGSSNNPSDVVLACGGRLCFDFSSGKPLLKIASITLRDGRGANGGAIYSPQINLGTFEINGCIFSNHTSTENGGAVYVIRSSGLKIIGTHFIDNKCEKDGGAIYVDSSQVTVFNATCNNNRAGLNGGCLSALSTTTGSKLNLERLKTESNQAGNSGGAFYFKGAIITVEGSSGYFDVARGRDSGGYARLESCSLTISSGTVVGSIGGGFVATGSTLKLSDVVFNGTKNTKYGGAVMVTLSSVDISKCHFFGCHANGVASVGGALGLTVKSTCKIMSSTFSSNSAVAGGGAIVCDDCDTLIIKSSAFLYNSAGRGGAIYFTGEENNALVEGSKFEQNSAQFSGGGAIYWKMLKPPTLIRNKKNNNTAEFGAFIASSPRSIQLIATSIDTNILNTKAFGPEFDVIDYYNNTFIDHSQSTPITLSIASTTAQPFGNLFALVNQNGRANFADFGIAASPGRHKVQVTSSSSTVKKFAFEVNVDDCLPGEFLSKIEEMFSCVDCEPGFYSDPTGSIGINPKQCTPCPEGTFQDKGGKSECKKCAPNLYSNKGSVSCGDPIVDLTIPVVGNLIRSAHRDDPFKLILNWDYPDDLRKGSSRPMVDVALTPDFASATRGPNGNLTVVVNESLSSAFIRSRKPIHDLVVYARVRIDNGVAVGQWNALLEPWLVTSDCNDDHFLDDLGSADYPPDTWKTTYPDLWNCTKCPDGSSCLGNVKWENVKTKFGWWRVDIPNNDEIGVPDEFARCFFSAACLGVSNLAMAGKYFNGSMSNEMTERNDLAILGTEHERCNWEWGHAQKCKDGLRVHPNGDPVMVNCRLCFTCREGFKKMGRARCKVCPDTDTNRVLIVVGGIAVVAAGVCVVFLSIASAGTEAEVSEGVKKIGINFMQICSLAALFPLKWPAAVESVFAIMNAVSSPAQHLLSPDCELSWMSASEAFYNKQIGFSILPITSVFICLFLWLIGYCINAKKYGRSPAYYYDRSILTIVCILFLLYPTMVKQSFATLACEKVGPKYYLAADLQETCYVGRHLYYVVAVCLPQIIVYTIGMPFVAVVVLWKHRFQLENMRVRFRYGILYNGYRARLYWWELTIAFRKVALVLIAGVYGTRLGPDMQVVVALMMVMLFTASHLLFQPFSAEDQRFFRDLPTDVLQKTMDEMKIKKRKEQEVKKREKKIKNQSNNVVTNASVLNKRATDNVSNEDMATKMATKMASKKEVTDSKHQCVKFCRELYFRSISQTNMRE
jgi:predicted outer membrane repeat protein